MKRTIRIPGLIDVHVHLREPGAEHKEDFTTGTMAAIAGGYTTVIDMPNNPEQTISLEALEKKISLIKNRIHCDVGFHFGASVDNFAEFSLVKDKVFGLKIYMNHTTGMMLIEDKAILEKIFSAWPAQGRILVHAEADTLALAISLARKYKKPLHMCHMALEEEVFLVRAAKAEGLDITAEVACHHLFLTKDDVSRLGPFGIMKPHLFSKNDQDALWRALEDGTIDIIASDHAPHAQKEKMSNNPPLGVPGLETSLSLMLTAVHEKRISLDKIIDLMSVNPGRIFGIQNDPKTSVEIDLEHSYEIRSKNLYTKCGWSPFEGMKVFGGIMAVTLRGKRIFQNGTFLSIKPQGKYIYPQSNQ